MILTIVAPIQAGDRGLWIDRVLAAQMASVGVMYAEVLGIKTLNDRSEQGELKLSGREG